MDRSLGATNVATDIDKLAESMIAEADFSVVHLTSPMTLKENRSVLVTCDTMVKIELTPASHTFISASIPTTITAPKEFTISPTACLGPNFARLWRKLPVELRENILRFNLVFEEPYAKGKSWWHPRRQGKHREELLMQYLAMGPEISLPARRVFYEKNRFLLKCSSHTWPLHFWAPKMDLRPLLRHITLEVCLHMTDWNYLRKFAEFGCGFEKLQTLHIYAGKNGQLANGVMRLDQRLRVHFEYKGKIELAIPWNGAPLDPNDKMLLKLKQLITFAGNEQEDTEVQGQHKIVKLRIAFPDPMTSPTP
jgi:hypothetical protein